MARGLTVWVVEICDGDTWTIMNGGMCLFEFGEINTLSVHPDEESATLAMFDERRAYPKFKYRVHECVLSPAPEPGRLGRRRKGAGVTA